MENKAISTPKLNRRGTDQEYVAIAQEANKRADSVNIKIRVVLVLCVISVLAVQHLTSLAL